VRVLIIRVTTTAAVFAALLSALISAATQATWPVLVLRALIALILVSVLGFLFGLILMRTALRRWYEQDQAVQASRRARGNR
jgi:ABC-type multidrug transport system permease subunit